MKVRSCLGLAVLAALAAGGCARQQPCLVIPMQLKLAQYEMEAYEKQVNARQGDVDRDTNGLSMAETRLQQLEEEEAQLRVLIEAARADTAGKGARP